MTPSAELSKRTPEEIFAHHVEALGAEDPDATALDYADGAYLITQDGVMHGKDAIRGFFAAVFRRFLKRSGVSRRPMLKTSCSLSGLPTPGLVAYLMEWIPLSLRMG